MQNSLQSLYHSNQVPYPYPIPIQINSMSISDIDSNQVPYPYPTSIQSNSKFLFHIQYPFESIPNPCQTSIQCNYISISIQINSRLNSIKFQIHIQYASNWILIPFNSEFIANYMLNCTLQTNRQKWTKVTVSLRLETSGLLLGKMRFCPTPRRHILVQLR